MYQIQICMLNKVEKVLKSRNGTKNNQSTLFAHALTVIVILLNRFDNSVNIVNL